MDLDQQPGLAPESTEFSPPEVSPEDLAAAKFLAHYIEFGVLQQPPPDIPHEWRPVFVAVGEAHGGRAARSSAFTDAIKDTPHQFRFSIALAKAAPPRENRGTFGRTLWSAEDALGEPPAAQWLVEELFIRPSLNVLVGNAGSKKTLFALDLAVCLALGKPWLGRSVTQATTLIVDEETGRPRLWSRIHNSLLAHDGNKDTPLFFYSLPGFDLRLEPDCRILRNEAEQIGAGLIVIDALADVIRSGDENSALSVNPLMENLRLLAEESHAAVLLIHHNNREGAFRGSSHISAAVDLLLSIESPPDSDLITLKPLKTRYTLPQPFAARAHFGPSRFWLTEEQIQPNLEQKPKLSLAGLRLLQALAKRGPSTTSDLMSALTQNAPGATRGLVHALAKTGYIARVDHGDRGTPATFELTVKGLDYVAE
jgi:hypothetical protein